jgi:hypothetical protein
MSENKNAIEHSMLGAYLSRGYQNTHNKRLDNFLKTGGHLASTPLGALIHTMIMKSLQRKASQEDRANRSRQSLLLDEYRENKIKEKTMLQNLESELREKAEEKKSQHYNEHEKEKRAWEEEQSKIKRDHEMGIQEKKIARELAKEKRLRTQKIFDDEESSDRNRNQKIEDEKRNFATKSFANPIEAMAYMEDPDNYEGRLKNYDPRGVFSRALGMLHGTPWTNENKLRIEK